MISTIAPREDLLHSRSLWALLLTGMLIFGTGLFLLTEDAREQFNEMATATSDNRQWNLAQAEVEFLRFQNAVLAAQASGDGDPALLNAMRLRFDVFYSRMMTIQNGATIEVTRRDSVNAERIARVVRSLDGLIPAIDGNNAQLQAAVPDLIGAFPALFEDVRQLSLNGSAAISADALDRRADVTKAFRNLGVLTVALVVLLLVFVMALLEFIRRERRQAQEKTVIQNRISSIIRTAIEGLVAIDATGRIIEFNPAAEKIFGVTRQTAIGADLGDLLVPEGDRAAYRSAFDMLKKTGQHPIVGRGAVQVAARRQNGETFPAEITVSGTSTQTNRMYFAFVRDISDRVAAQREIEDARDRALAGERAKSEFLTVMSHEMRTPLNGILGTLELLQADTLTAKQRVYTDVIASSGRALLQHVNSVIDITQADTQKISVAQRRFDIGALLSGLVDAYTPEAAAQGIALTLHMDQALGRVTGDAARLKQILENFVSNAIKFTAEGTVTVRVAPDGSSGAVLFEVVDTGIGIPEADRDRIFQDFVALDASFTRASDGTGLGLGLGKRLAEAMGGEIGVDSQVGQGSRFWLRLPLLSKRTPGTTTKKHQRKTYPNFGLSVLVVEDNRINRLVVREMLAKFGCGVVEAVNGQEGVSAAARDRYDLIFMDISMPVMDGVTATSLIKQQGMNTMTPIYALTAHAQPDEIATFRDAGVVETIVKPLNTDRLQSTLEQVSRVGTGA